MLVRVCRNCLRLIAVTSSKTQRCPECRGLLRIWSRNRYSRTMIRNQEIIRRLTMEDITLQELGEEYGLTRERIRQIYERTTGKDYGDIVQKRRERIKTERIILESKPREKRCPGCQKLYIITNNVCIYCSACHLIARQGRKPNVLKNCLVCEKEFHPFKNVSSMSQQTFNRGRFCSRTCSNRFIHNN